MDRKHLQKHFLFKNHSSAIHKQQFEELYHQHIDALHNYGIKFHANPELVEDCIQDLFADLWEKWHELDKIQSVRSYLLGALRRKVLRKIYSTRELPYSEEELTDFFDIQLMNSSTVQERVSEDHLLQIKNAFEKLTEKQKEVLYLRFYNQLSFKEIAEIMSVQTRTIYKLARRSITFLKEELSHFTHAFQVLILYLFS